MLWQAARQRVATFASRGEALLLAGESAGSEVLGVFGAELFGVPSSIVLETYEGRVCIKPCPFSLYRESL